MNTPFYTHYDDTDTSKGGNGDDTLSGDAQGGEGGDKGKMMTQAQIDKIVADRTDRYRGQNRKMLTQLEDLQGTAKLSAEERDALNVEVEELRKRTLSQTEIEKREAKKATEKYQKELVAAQETATTWQGRYDNLRISYEIKGAAVSNKVLPQSLNLVESFLRPNTKLVEKSDEEGKGTGQFETVVDFADQDSEGKPITTTMTIPEVIKRMSELPDLYGNLFEGSKSGGLGGNSGTGGGRPGDPSKMSTEEYIKYRKENPQAALGES